MSAQQLGWLINATTITLVIANALLTLRFRRARYSAGWIDGRLAMLSSMSEAQRRGIPADEWIKSEAQRDAANHLPELSARMRALGIEIEDERDA